MKNSRNIPIACLREQNHSSGAPLLMILAFLSFMTFGALGFITALAMFLLIGQTIVLFPKLARKVRSVLQKTPLWRVGLTLAFLLAVAGFIYSSLSHKPAPAPASSVSSFR